LNYRSLGISNFQGKVGQLPRSIIATLSHCVKSNYANINRKEVQRNVQCWKCSYTGPPEGKDHYHIVVEKGRVTQVDFVSINGCWDRELEKDEYFVEYIKDSRKSWLGKLWKLPAITIPTFGHSRSEEWEGPKLYKGSSDWENGFLKWLRKLFS
jgi:hypothetical protein